MFTVDKLKSWINLTLWSNCQYTVNSVQYGSIQYINSVENYS